MKPSHLSSQWLSVRRSLQANSKRFFLPVVCLLCLNGRAAMVMEENFDFPLGSDLAANPPWSGAGSAIGVVSGNLSYPQLQGGANPGNSLQVVAGNSAVTIRNFTDSPVTQGNVYFAALINCSSLPQSSSAYIASLQATGGTGPSGGADPLCLYVRSATNGYRLGIRHTEIDANFASTVLTANTTHLVVMKYLFGNGGDSQLYIDPTPGSDEPARPDADSLRGWEAGDDPPPIDAPNLQVIGFLATTDSTQGAFVFDTLRIGTAWADVVPTGTGTALAITGPQSLASCAGGPAAFSVNVSGTPPFTYQWRAAGVPIAGATDSTYVLANPSPSDALVGYDVMVSDAQTSVASGMATLTLLTGPPIIDVQPENQVLQPGVSNATLGVTASGDGPLIYQWRTNGVPIPGATNSSYHLANIQTADTLNIYDVVVANPCGSTTSASPVWLRFPAEFLSSAALPGFFSGMNLITTNLAGMSLFVWSSSDLSQSITNWALEGQLAEQPLNDGTANSRYSLNVTPTVSPEYYILGQTTAPPYGNPTSFECITTDALGNESFSISNTTISADGLFASPTQISIVSQPAAQTVLIGKTATFSVMAAGAGPLSYQWYLNSTIPLAAATDATLTLAGVQSANAGNYSVVVSNSYGNITSSLAALAVVPAPVLAALRVANGIQFAATGIQGDPYWVQAATDLSPPVAWVTVSTNIAGANGLLQWTEIRFTSPRSYYRIVSP